MTDVTETQSRKAFRELLASLAEVDERYLSTDFGVTSEQDDADGHRFLIHLLETALHREFEGDPEHPEFTKWVTPRRKVLGDNPDAIYFEAPVDPRYAYRVTRQPRRRGVHVVHDRRRHRRRQVRDPHRGRDQRHELRRRARRQLRDHARWPAARAQLDRRCPTTPATSPRATTSSSRSPRAPTRTRVVPLTIERIGAESARPAPSDRRRRSPRESAGQQLRARQHASSSRRAASRRCRRSCRSCPTCSRSPSCRARWASPRSTPPTPSRPLRARARRSARHHRPLARVSRSPTSRSGTASCRPTTT